jgi:hypothetical protein
VGDAVEGNAHWYRIEENTFIWAGACTRPDPYPAFPENNRVNWMAVVFEEIAPVAGRWVKLNPASARHNG